MRACFFAGFTDKPCDLPSQLDWCKAHIIPKQLLTRLGHDPWDRRAWEWSCGGPWPHLSGHHGMFDAKKIQVPRAALPPGLEELVEELGMVWWLDERFPA